MKYQPFYLDRYMDKVNMTESCWLWMGCLQNGYGFVTYKGKQERTHRVAYELAIGPIPVGLSVLHKCEANYPPGNRTSRRCVNPDHLYAGTPKNNVDDARRNGRMPTAKPKIINPNSRSAIRVRNNAEHAAATALMRRGFVILQERYTDWGRKLRDALIAEQVAEGLNDDQFAQRLAVPLETWQLTKTKHIRMTNDLANAVLIACPKIVALAATVLYFPNVSQPFWSILDYVKGGATELAVA